MTLEEIISLPVSASNCYVFNIFGVINSKPLARAWRVSVTTLMWTIWLARNELVFKGNKLTKKTVLFMANQRSFKWLKAVGLVNQVYSKLRSLALQGCLLLSEHFNFKEFWNT